MLDIKHHIPESVMIAYTSGNLPHAYAVVVASHISLCNTCQRSLAEHQTIGGMLLDETDCVAVSDTSKSSLMSMLDMPSAPAAVFKADGVYPGAVMEALKGKPPKWKNVGGGVRQTILHEAKEGTVRLLHIPSGQAVPDHGHNGLELTLVLQGSFSDETGQFRVGDVEVADQDLDHTPIADPGCDCICLAATNAPLKFNSFFPRLLQPLFRI